MGFFEEMGRKRESDFYSHVSEEVKQRVEKRTKIGVEEFERMTLNSYEATLVYPLLDDVAYVKLVRRFLLNCSERKLYPLEVATTYDQALLGSMVEGLCQRLEESRRNPPT